MKSTIGRFSLCGLSCLFFGLCGWEAPGCAAEPQTVAVVSPVSRDFKQRVVTASWTVPTHVWQGLRKAGWRVRLAEFVVDAAPALRGVQPRGWPAGMTWEHTDGVHVPRQRMLVFAEKRQTRAGTIVDNQRLDGVLRHETGHAFDMVAGSGKAFRSSSREFMSAYFKDVNRIRRDDRKTLAYYLQPRGSGRQETFAEAFAILLGGGSDAKQRKAFVRCFPNVLRYVRAAITDYEPQTLSR